MRRTAALAIGMAALALAACGRRERPAADAGKGGWVARAGAVTVTRAELEAYARRGRPEGLAGIAPEQRRALARRLVVRKALAAEAEREGLGADPAVERAVMEWKFRTYPDVYWRETVWKQVEIGDEELRERLRPQARHDLAAIVLGDDEAAGELARQLHAQLGAGADFAELAREHSRGFAAAKGGEMGWTELPSQMVEAPEAAVIEATAPGGYTAPVRTRLGWTIFKVRARKGADEVFAEEKAAALPGLLGAKYDEERARRVAELRAAATITYPAESAPPGSGAPAAVVNGYVFPAEAEPEDRDHARIQRDVTPRKQLLEKTIATLLIVMDAERRGVDRDPQLQAGLALQRVEALAQLYLRAKGEAVTVTPAEEREEYGRFYSPDVYEIEMIVTASRERAAEARARARAGEDFGALAREYNTGRLAASAGQVPLGSTAQFAPAIQAALPQLADGAVSEVLDAGAGTWGIVRRVAKHRFDPPPFEQVADQVRRRLELRKRSELTDAFAERFSAQLAIELDEAALAAL